MRLIKRNAEGSETANGRNRDQIWLGEAPDRSYGSIGAADGFLPNGVGMPKDAPSRGTALGHGSARSQAYRHHPTDIISGFDPIARSCGSLAPPNLIAHSPFRAPLTSLPPGSTFRPD